MDNCQAERCSRQVGDYLGTRVDTEMGLHQVSFMCLGSDKWVVLAIVAANDTRVAVELEGLLVQMPRFSYVGRQRLHADSWLLVLGDVEFSLDAKGDAVCARQQVLSA